MIITTDVALNTRYITSEPQIFRIGNMVQAQVSFIVIPMKGGRRKMLTVLCSLVLLDGSLSNVTVWDLLTIDNSILIFEQ
jgi:hypothetical protein